MSHNGLRSVACSRTSPAKLHFNLRRARVISDSSLLMLRALHYPTNRGLLSACLDENTLGRPPGQELIGNRRFPTLARLAAFRHGKLPFPDPFPPASRKISAPPLRRT